ncbi:hypothetical protein GGTG_05565 [Gaeumannomyces tritici R3-111a-1]|uniref:Beta/gamma crystallin 'Greek key' domain-containing protein n=1 Tax=Gaeumannomyces tritici (strain R3-111a-1) TaxID=644352 RepID=J3NWA0_GAET3|nr:hypothetical protein GGTG_05565 [Gaeumannomyces tritici R3-111a-1]EJT75632.1 hypothetical protein GGTG_05565 [Gaeumannomyces tritici R3-111a-1]
MVSMAKLAVLATAVLGRAATAAPASASAPPPVVEAAPMPPGGIPNTPVPSSALAARDVDGLSKRALTEIQFWKDTHFRGEYVLTGFESGLCYTFTGTWDHWNKAVSSVDIISGGPCWVYEGVRCDIASLGPITYGTPIAELGKFDWDNRFGSVTCHA